MSKQDAMVEIEIDGRRIQAAPGSMLIQAADAAGIYIPRFCYHKKLSVAANCRMCLVEVEKAPKPLPACATPVTEGMKVRTRSPLAVAAQKGTMEFLLINHPLDCPICDQGGECDLQDLAVGYGGDVSRYSEAKRVVPDKDLGPLIATDMTRCIHCTRCVRFGQEIAGIMELGATGRGEHTRIGTYVERAVTSELSGNVIDLCPVGALTSKPFRYQARAWELTDVPGVGPHDAVGSNLRLQVRRGRVMRVLPREHEEINECWLSDRDRFSYQALNGEARLTEPLVRAGDGWEPTDWQTALERAAAGLKRVLARHGPEALGVLGAPQATLEELYLLQKLARALGCHNVDHRLRQVDFSLDPVAPLFPNFGLPVAALEARRAVLLVGSNVRKEQPLLALRLRKASLKGARILAINPVDHPFTFDLAAKAVVPPSALVGTLARVARAVLDRQGVAWPGDLAPWLDREPGAAEREMAQALLEAGESGAVLLGQVAASHPHYGVLYVLARLIADHSGASAGVMLDANSAGGWLAGALPHRGPLGAPVDRPGRHARDMLTGALPGYLLLGAEPELDAAVSGQAAVSLRAAECVVAITPFRGPALEYAEVLLPAGAFAETDGSFVSGEGRVQSFPAAVPPPGEARPAWKILRVLANELGLEGFEQISAEEVRAELNLPELSLEGGLGAAGWSVPAPARDEKRSDIDLERIYEVPPYAVDPLVRRASALQATADNPPPAARMNAGQARALGLAAGQAVNVHLGRAFVRLPLEIDPAVPDGCIRIPGGLPDTSPLDGPGLVRVVGA